jgi:hypothetical protein
MEVTGDQIQAYKADVQEVPVVVLGFSLGLLGLYEIWHCHDEAVPLLPVGLDIFCKLHLKAPTELHSKMQNSHFYHTSENGLTVLPDNPTGGGKILKLFG